MIIYEGTGKISSTTIAEVEGNFKLMIDDDEKSTLEVYATSALPIEMYELPITPFSFSGKAVGDEYEVSIPKCYLTNLNIASKKPDLRFNITHSFNIIYNKIDINKKIKLVYCLFNLLFDGMEKSRHDNRFVYDKITLKIKEFDIEIKQIKDYKNIKSELKLNGGVKYTANLSTIIDHNSLGDLREISNDLINLITLAVCNYVTKFYEAIYQNEKLMAIEYYPLKTYDYKNNTPIISTNIHDIKEFKNYLEITYPIYVAKKDDMGLHYCIELFTTSKLFYPMEVSYILSSTLVETLDWYYKNSAGLADVTLRNKIRRLLKYAKICVTEAEINNFIVTRNGLVHEGHFDPAKDNLNLLLNLRNILDKLLLGLLDYHNNLYFNVQINNKELLS